MRTGITYGRLPACGGGARGGGGPQAKPSAPKPNRQETKHNTRADNAGTHAVLSVHTVVSPTYAP